MFKLVSGSGLAGFTPVVMTYLSEYTPIKSRALVTTMAISCVSVGSVISTAVCMGVLQTWGWRPLYFIAFVPIILFPLIALKMPDSPAHYVKTGKTDKVRNVLEKADPSFTPEPDDEYVVSDEEKAEKPSVIEALKGYICQWNGQIYDSVLDSLHAHDVHLVYYADLACTPHGLWRIWPYQQLVLLAALQPLFASRSSDRWMDCR